MTKTQRLKNSIERKMRRLEETKDWLAKDDERLALLQAELKNKARTWQDIEWEYQCLLAHRRALQEDAERLPREIKRQKARLAKLAKQENETAHRVSAAPDKPPEGIARSRACLLAKRREDDTPMTAQNYKKLDKLIDKLYPIVGEITGVNDLTFTEGYPEGKIQGEKGSAEVHTLKLAEIDGTPLYPVQYRIRTRTEKK